MMTLVVPIYFKKSANKTADVDVVTVNNFFARWLKQIDIRSYPDDVRILRTNNTVKVYNYPAQQIKHFPAKSLDDKRNIFIWKKSSCFDWKQR